MAPHGECGGDHPAQRDDAFTAERGLVSDVGLGRTELCQKERVAVPCCAQKSIASAALTGVVPARLGDRSLRDGILVCFRSLMRP
jgi:hypothetical protein